jgi:hypothetical protein
MIKSDYTALGVLENKICVTANPSICLWSVSRECLVGGGKLPRPEELIKLEDGNYELTYENNRLVSLLRHSEINVDEINNSSGIIISEDETDECFIFEYIPTT